MRRKRQTEDEAFLEAKARIDALVKAEVEQSEAELQRTLAVARAETSAMLRRSTAGWPRSAVTSSSAPSSAC